MKVTKPQFGMSMTVISMMIAAIANIVIASATALAQPKLTLTRLNDHIYIAEDYFYNKENSAIYIGDRYVTVIGATWTPETAKLLAQEISKITDKPIKEVVDINYHPDRAGGNAFFKSIGAEIVSTQMTYNLLKSSWEDVVKYTQKGIPNYPSVSLVLPDKVYDGDFELQGGNVRGIYLGPSHTPDGIFVFFPTQHVLYGGCILKEHLGNLDFANLEEYPRTLIKLKQFQIRQIIAGHWAPVHGPELVDQYIQLLKSSQTAQR